MILAVTYIHTDALGSPVARSDSAGNVISRTSYEPYGRTASGITSTIGFTGHVNDADTGLVYMQQRYYDPVAGRFLSVDPVTTDAHSGSSFNRYVYANNSPYKYIDPDGREVEIIGDDKYKSKVAAQVEKLTSKPEGAKAWAEIVASPELITVQTPVVPGNGNSTTSSITADKSPSGSAIQFDPDDTRGATDAKGGTERPAFVGLGHEVGHAAAAAKGQQSKDAIGTGLPGSTPPRETQALKLENAIRAEHGLPLRPDYYPKK